MSTVNCKTDIEKSHTAPQKCNERSILENQNLSSGNQNIKSIKSSIKNMSLTDEKYSAEENIKKGSEVALSATNIKNIVLSENDCVLSKSDYFKLNDRCDINILNHKIYDKKDGDLIKTEFMIKGMNKEDCELKQQFSNSIVMNSIGNENGNDSSEHSSKISDIGKMQESESKYVVKGPWSKEEDSRLVILIKKHGPKNWSKIADDMKTRVGKQCRERWHNHLHPSIKKTPFTNEEDVLIIKLHIKFGNRWSEISKFLPGRTDNAIKNHWNSALQKKMKKRSFSVESVVCIRNEKCCCSDCVRIRTTTRHRSESVNDYAHQVRVPLHKPYCRCRECTYRGRPMKTAMKKENDDVIKRFERMTDDEKIASIALLTLYGAL